MAVQLIVDNDLVECLICEKQVRLEDCVVEESGEDICSDCFDKQTKDCEHQWKINHATYRSVCTKCNMTKL